jgi:hypothetical protein
MNDVAVLCQGNDIAKRHHNSYYYILLLLLSQITEEKTAKQNRVLYYCNSRKYTLQIQKGSRLPTGWFPIYKFNVKVSSTRVLSPTEYSMAQEISTREQTMTL